MVWYGGHLLAWYGMVWYGMVWYGGHLLTKEMPIVGVKVMRHKKYQIVTDKIYSQLRCQWISLQLTADSEIPSFGHRGAFKLWLQNSFCLGENTGHAILHARPYNKLASVLISLNQTIIVIVSVHNSYLMIPMYKLYPHEHWYSMKTLSCINRIPPKRLALQHCGVVIIGQAANHTWHYWQIARFNVRRLEYDVKKFKFQDI